MFLVSDVSVAPTAGAEVSVRLSLCAVTPSFLVYVVKLPVAYSLLLRKPPRRPSRTGEREGHIIETTCGDEGLLVHYSLLLLSLIVY